MPCFTLTDDDLISPMYRGCQDWQGTPNCFQPCQLIEIRLLQQQRRIIFTRPTRIVLSCKAIIVMGKSTLSKGSGQTYAILEPRVRHVPEAAVRKRWKTLATGPQANVKQLLLSLKTQPVTRNARVFKAADSRAIVEEVVHKYVN